MGMGRERDRASRVCKGAFGPERWVPPASWRLMCGQPGHTTGDSPVVIPDKLFRHFGVIVGFVGHLGLCLAAAWSA